MSNESESPVSLESKILEIFSTHLTLDPARIRKLLSDDGTTATTAEIRSILDLHSDIFQMNQKVNRVERYRQYQTYHVGELVQIDLMFLNSPRNTNQKILLEGGYQYALIAIDTYTRYLQVVPVKTKGALEVANAIAKVVTFLREGYYGGLDYYKFKLLADDGKEFSPQRIADVVKNVQLLRSKSKHGASIAERAILEIRNKIRLLKGSGTVALTLEELQQVVNVINNAPKKTVSTQGFSATEMLTGYDKSPDKLIPVYPEKDDPFKLPLGGYCRIVNYAEKDGKIFVKKSAYNNYTAKIFSVLERSLDGIQNIPIYTLVSLDGTYLLDTTWYEEELLWVKTDFVKTLTNEERDEHEDFTSEEIKVYRIVSR